MITYLPLILKLASELEEAIPETMRSPFKSEQISFSKPVVTFEYKPGDGLKEEIFKTLKSINSVSHNALMDMTRHPTKEHLYMKLDENIFHLKRDLNQLTNLHVDLGQEDEQSEDDLDLYFSEMPPTEPAPHVAPPHATPQFSPDSALVPTSEFMRRRANKPKLQEPTPISTHVETKKDFGI